MTVRAHRNAPDIERIRAIPPLGDSPAYVPLRQVVYDALLGAIRGRILPPGTSVIENQLAQHLGVSRTPVREALRQLEADGLIELLPGRKAVVATATAQNIRDIYGIRLIVEPAALQEIGADDPLLGRLRDLIAVAEEYLESNNAEGFCKTNVTFHLTVVSALKNVTLDELMTSLNHTIGTYLTALFADESRPHSGHAEHLEIVRCLERGDTAEASRLMRTHLETGRDLLLSHTSFA